jgi:phosphatidylserine/phosphatidylglycerophosphate/cardiolipin synthase-like enzyme
MLKRDDLNLLEISNDYGPDLRLPDNSVRSGAVSAHFKDLEKSFVRHLADADAAVSCMAWLTNPAILKAFRKLKRGACIVVQKEDFLRPDTSSRKGFAKRLRADYAAIPALSSRYHLKFVAGLSVCSDDRIDPVRCVGNHNKDRSPAFPRMHNKFVVMMKARVAHSIERYGDEIEYAPYAVWTGSFNFSENGSKSLENAVFIRDKAIADAYYDEWSHIVALSEPLDWETPWSQPEWRLGT